SSRLWRWPRLGSAWLSLVFGKSAREIDGSVQIQSAPFLEGLPITVAAETLRRDGSDGRQAAGFGVHSTAHRAAQLSCSPTEARRHRWLLTNEHRCDEVDSHGGERDVVMPEEFFHGVDCFADGVMHAAFCEGDRR